MNENYDFFQRKQYIIFGAFLEFSGIIPVTDHFAHLLPVRNSQRH
jgi:hypothetical protein